MPLSIKIRLIMCYVFPVFYGAKTWITTETLLNKLEAFKMRVYSWPTILQHRGIKPNGKRKKIVFTIKRQKLNWYFEGS